LCDSATPKKFRRDIGRRFGLQNLKGLGIASLAVAGFRGENAKFPIQVRVACRFFQARFSKRKGLVTVTLLKQKAGLSVSLFQRGPLTSTADCTNEQERDNRN
jgi:hypothetical protein